VAEAGNSEIVYRPGVFQINPLRKDQANVNSLEGRVSVPELSMLKAGSGIQKEVAIVWFAFVA
jgi:hypothetical protein